LSARGFLCNIDKFDAELKLIEEWLDKPFEQIGEGLRALVEAVGDETLNEIEKALNVEQNENNQYGYNYDFSYKLNNVSECAGEWNSNINSIAAEGVEINWHQSSWSKKRHPKFIIWSKKKKKRLKTWSREKKRRVKMKVLLKMTGRVKMKLQQAS
jgi:hypothetical protein